MRTSDTEKLYTTENGYGAMVVVTETGEQKREYAVDMKGNITSYFTSEIVVPAVNVKHVSLSANEKGTEPQVITNVTPVAAETEETPQPAEQEVRNAAPEIQAVTAEKPVITKHPTGETKTAGDSAVFIAHADGADSAQWFLISPDGTVISLINAGSGVSGATVSGADSDVLKISNLTVEYSGAKVFCSFSNEAGSTESGAAEITVTERKRTEIPGHSHRYTSSVTLKAGCESAGKREYRCSCGDSYTETIAPTGHVYICGICIYCGRTKNETKPPAAEPAAPQTGTVHSHVWSDPVTTKEASCTSAGTVMRRCSCGETKTETVPAKGHSFVNGICSGCGAQDGTHVHSWDGGTVTREPGCETDGTREYVCRECGSRRTEAIAAKGHSYDRGRCTECRKADPNHVHTWDAGTVNVEPSCTAQGSMLRKCTVCGDTELVTMEPKGHRYGPDGKCADCGNADNIFRGYGLYLKSMNMSENEKMLSIVRFVREHGYGACTGYSGMCVEAAEYAGLRCEFRQIGDIRCSATGQWHTADSFNADGYCRGCGLGDNHHWVRFILSDGFYEFDIYGGDTYCVNGVNASRF